MEEFKLVPDDNCPVCGAINNEFLIRKYDDRFGQPDLFEYCFCKKCNIAFLKNKIQESSLSDLYKKYYRKESDQPVSISDRLKLILGKSGLDKIIIGWLTGNKFLLKYVPNNSKVLEIGSGYVPELKNIVIAKKLDWTGLEVDADLVSRLRRDGLRAIHGTIKLNNIQDQFDCIVSAQSLEHHYDINDFFENCKKLLKNGGKVFFSTPNLDSRYRRKYADGWINWHAPYHITLLSEKSIGLLCKKYGFVISKFSACTPTGWYLFQKNFKVSKKGEANMTFNFNFPIIRRLLASIFLRIYETFDKKTGDCIYCEIKLK